MDTQTFALFFRDSGRDQRIQLPEACPSKVAWCLVGHVEEAVPAVKTLYPGGDRLKIMAVITRQNIDIENWLLSIERGCSKSVAERPLSWRWWRLLRRSGAVTVLHARPA